MVELIRYLHNKDLAIIKPNLDDSPEVDLIFYFYKKMDENEIKEKPIDELLKNGKIIIGIKDLLEEVNKQNKKLISEISMDFEGEYLLYNLFGYFLFIKLALREIQNTAYAKGFTKIASIIAMNEVNIAYEFSQYLLNNWDYDKGLIEDVLDIVNDRDKFNEYYYKFKEKINKHSFDKKEIEWAYDDFKEEFTKIDKPNFEFQ